MRYSIEGETSVGDGGVVSLEDVHVDRAPQAIQPTNPVADVVGQVSVGRYGVSYSGNEDETNIPVVVIPPTHPIFNNIP